MALTCRLVFAALIAGPFFFVSGLAYAQADAGPEPSGPDAPIAPKVPAAEAQVSDAGPQGQFEPPHARVPPSVPTPTDAPEHKTPIVVTVKLLVNEQGAVKTVTLMTAPQAVFDEAVIEAAKDFEFAPGRYNGQPVEVEITFTHTFAPPPVATQSPAATDAVLRGRLVERGTGATVIGGVIAAKVGDRDFAIAADTNGRFRLAILSGTATVTASAPGYNRFLQRETLAAGQEVVVTYYVERERYDPYEIVILGDQKREEASRVTLRGPELQQVPGTFGDPYRVIVTLPGVATAMSLLPYPIIRGASPSATGLLLDGTRLPMLFHMLSGPSVVHPDFIDEVQFYPGGAPVTYGGYTGGLVDGRTVHARPEDQLIDVDANLLQAGGLVRQPIKFLGATMTAAARYGYPGGVLSLATSDVSLSYWDYQLRLDGGNVRNGWTLFAYGAQDTLKTVAATADPADPNPPLEPALVLGFHRVEARLRHTIGRFRGSYRIVTGYDKTVSSGANIGLFAVEPSARWRWRHDDKLTLRAGLEGKYHNVSQGEGAMPLDQFIATSITEEVSTSRVGSALAEIVWRPTSAWLIRPGVRADVWQDSSATKSGIDPRITVRRRLSRDKPGDANNDDDHTWLKGSVGVYHQPPRFVLPLPGLDTMPLKYGLLRSTQTSLGVEAPLTEQLRITAEAFFNYLAPTTFDLSVNAGDLNNGANTSVFPTTTMPSPSEAQELLDRLLVPQIGRTYGGELLIRRQVRNGLFGWLSYTLSRTERRRDGVWRPYDFDRTHLLNLVGGIPLKRNWDIGLRLQYSSGKPATTTFGYNTARASKLVRFDLRVDKRAVWNEWLLDFYIDITNVVLLPEEVTPGTTIRYVLPTFGVRGRF